MLMIGSCASKVLLFLDSIIQFFIRVPPRPVYFVTASPGPGVAVLARGRLDFRRVVALPDPSHTRIKADRREHLSALWWFSPLSCEWRNHVLAGLFVSSRRPAMALHPSCRLPRLRPRGHVAIHSFPLPLRTLIIIHFTYTPYDVVHGFDCIRISLRDFVEASCSLRLWEFHPGSTSLHLLTRPPLAGLGPTVF